MIVIVSDNEKEQIGTRLHRYLLEQGQEARLIPASGRDVKPCFSCGGCTDKTFGKCIIRDDMDEILPVLGKAERIIYTTPVVWGGMSYDIKRILDKTALLGNHFYKLRNKEIVKGSITDNHSFIMIGVSEKPSIKTKDSFHGLAKEIANIMDADNLTKILQPDASDAEISAIAKEVLAL